MSCSPDWSTYQESGLLGKIRVCMKFADKIYDACKGSETYTLSGDCESYGDKYANAQEMIEGVFGATYYDGSDPCFNSGSLIQPAFFITLVASLALFFKF